MIEEGADREEAERRRDQPAKGEPRDRTVDPEMRAAMPGDRGGGVAGVVGDAEVSGEGEPAERFDSPACGGE